jgi:hypothetical protein
MQTTTLIQAQANVMKITQLKIGDIFKMVDTKYSNLETYFGVVLDLLNTGDKAFIQLLIYKRSYSNCIDTEIRTIKGDDDIALFPAHLDEIRDDFQHAIAGIEENIKTKKRELQITIDALEKTKQFVSGEMAKKLTEMTYQTITQQEFDAQRNALKEPVSVSDSNGDDIPF